ncbi:hypothetical protein EI546_06380 [Aequorivita sp. H23M31]|uniref:XRE family transcriptional regulator n=1 Tax=Aequorivita ciconiae TaxID=2494375 RepID=A0A410G283_9FLAO|nr:hypothetical protein [Aequorivita sp. H23M31]QAA81376.1 hypothetical protein EI546_06380 [Aequorivita sp. H23M31]
MKNNTDISVRLTKLIDSLGITRNEFAKNLGYDRTQGIYDMTKGKAKPSFDFFERLLNSEYSEIINIEWLLTGKGEMLKKTGADPLEKKPPEDERDQYLITLQQKHIEKLEKEIEQLKKELEPQNNYRNVAEPDR